MISESRNAYKFSVKDQKGQALVRQRNRWRSRIKCGLKSRICDSICVESEVLIAVSIFWDVTVRSPVGGYRRFGAKYGQQEAGGNQNESSVICSSEMSVQFYQNARRQNEEDNI
jgi:hypothetical protein